MARDKLITIRIEGEKREAFNQLAKAQNTDTASLLYDFISGCLDGKIDISLVTGKGQRIDNQLDNNRIDKLEATTQRIDRIDIAIQRLDNRIDGIETTTQRLAKRLDDWIDAIDDRLTDCDQLLSGKITSLEHRLNALSSQLDSQKDSQKDSQEIDDMEPLLKLQREASIATSPLPPSPPDRLAIETVTPEVSPSPPGTDAIASIDGIVETVNTSPLPPDKLGEGGNGDIFPDSPPDRPAIEDSEKKIIPLPDTLIVSPITDKTIDQNAIEDLTDQSSSPAKKKGLTDSELARHLGIDKSNITRWKQKGEPTQKYRDKWEFRGRFWYEKD